MWVSFCDAELFQYDLNDFIYDAPKISIKAP